MSDVMQAQIAQVWLAKESTIQSGFLGLWPAGHYNPRPQKVSLRRMRMTQGSGLPESELHECWLPGLFR